MKDAIIVRKVDWPIQSWKEGLEKKRWRDNWNYFDYSFTDPRTGFSWRKDHASNQKTRTEDNNHFFKESRTKIRRRNKKEQVAYLKEHEQEIVDFVKAQNPKIESVQIDWDETQWGVAGNGTPQGGDEMILILADLIKILNLVGELIWLWKMERLI